MEGEGLSFQYDVIFWVNTKHFCCFAKRKKNGKNKNKNTMHSALSQATTSQAFYFGSHTEKKKKHKKIINHTEVCCHTPQDEWPFVFSLLWTQRETVNFLPTFIFHPFQKERAYCSWYLANPATTPQQYHGPLAKELLYNLPFGSI